MILSAPNNSIVKGRIKNIKRNSKLTVELLLIDSKDVEGLPNFTRNRLGKEIQVLFDKKYESDIILGKEIDGIYIRYIGDERGGLFHGKFQ